jgi:flagellar motor switch protein FliN/FliY
MSEFEESSIAMGENIADRPASQFEYERPRFPQQSTEKGDSLFRQDIFGNIPVEITVEMGKAKITLKEVMDLSKGTVIELPRVAGEPLDLLVNGQLIGRGEVVAVDNYYGVRVTEVIRQA